MLNYQRYKRNPVLHYPEREWPDKQIEKAPIWCSVDLRDGNQALIEPMNVEEKMEMFELLLKLAAGRIRVGSSDGAVVSVSIACHLKPCMRFSLTRLSDNLLPATFKRLPHIFSYLDNKNTLFHWLHTTFEIHTAHVLCISSVFACNTPVSIASSTRIHQAV